MLHPAERIGAVAAFQPLHLPLTELQQTGGFAYAQPPACCILNHFHPLELLLTHRHHPWRVTESRCTYGVTLSWSIYTSCGTQLSSGVHFCSACGAPAEGARASTPRPQPNTDDMATIEVTATSPLPPRPHSSSSSRTSSSAEFLLTEGRFL